MINLSTLTALLRTLRYGAGGIDGPTAQISRVAPVPRVAGDDEGAVAATAARQQSFVRVSVPALTAEESTTTSRAPARSAGEARIATHGSAAAPVVPASSTRVSTVSTESTALDFTATGTLLQAALRGTEGRPPRPPTVEAPVPLAESSTGEATGLARALARSVSESGLFYESHLARWVRQDYPQTALAREPQAHWTATADVVDARAPAASVLPEAAATLVTRQLDALETRQVVWVGELWPGQRATIAFEEAPPEVNDGEADGREATASAWHTRLVVDLPSLGRVGARLTLSRGRFDVVLDADSAESAQRLAEARDALGDALEASKLVLRDFAVALKPGA